MRYHLYGTRKGTDVIDTHFDTDKPGTMQPDELQRLLNTSASSMTSVSLIDEDGDMFVLGDRLISESAFLIHTHAGKDA